MTSGESRTSIKVSMGEQAGFKEGRARMYRIIKGKMPFFKTNTEHAAGPGMADEIRAVWVG